MFEHEFRKKELISAVDGSSQRYFVRQGRADGPCMVFLHGHGSLGDQLMTRPDIARGWTAFLAEHDFSVISPDLRGNAWMSEPAVADLDAILEREKPLLAWNRLYLTAGSMGGTGALIFAIRHPERVDGVAAFGAATDLASYCAWLDEQNEPLHREIRNAITAAYPSEEDMRRNSALLHADRLTMPVWYLHGGADTVIPVSQARALAEKMRGRPDFRFREISGGNHDSPLAFYAETVTQLLKKDTEP